MRFERLIELCQALVINFFHDFDLSFHAFASVGFQQLKLFVNLDGDLLVEGLVQSYSDNGVSPLTNSFADNVVVNILNSALLGAELVWFSTQFYARVIGILILVNVVGQVSVVRMHSFDISIVLVLLLCAFCSRSRSRRDQSSRLSVLKLSVLITWVCSSKVCHGVPRLILVNVCRL